MGVKTFPTACDGGGEWERVSKREWDGAIVISLGDFYRAISPALSREHMETLLNTLIAPHLPHFASDSPLVVNKTLSSRYVFNPFFRVDKAYACVL